MSVNTVAAESASQINQTYKEAGKTNRKSGDYGKTIGSPKLSEEGQKYYEELKKKYGNMDFILVSNDMKEQAKAQAGSYANPLKTVVLIDEEKIERMATDEKFRKQYEAVISNAASGMSQMKSSLASTGAKVKGYGMQVNDGGTASFFAVLEKSSAAQRERIEKRAEARKSEKKAAEKKAEAKKTEKRAAEKKAKEQQEEETSNSITITAHSLEELMQKINDYLFTDESNYVQTQEEQMLGQHIDFRG